MTGTFSSLNTALSALRYQRIAMDVASNNIANVSSEGYVRRRAEAVALGSPQQVAMWSRYDGSGDGVALSGITRMGDPFLDMRSRREHGQQSYLDARVAVLDRVEGAIGEPGDTGVSAALADFRNAWQDLQSHPESAAARSQVLAAGQSVADALRVQASNIQGEMSDQRGHVLDLVAEINVTAQDLAAVNQNIADAAAAGLDTNDLADQRDLLALKLADLTGGDAKLGANGVMNVTVAGVPLVTGKDASTLAVASGIAADGSADGAPLVFSLTGPSGTATLGAASLKGELGGTSELLTGTLPDYLSGLDSVARQLADTVNALHTTGYDANGAAGQPFFSYDPTGAASSLTVAITDPNGVVSSAQAGTLDTSIAEALGDLSVADDAYQRLVNGFATQVASSKRASTNQALLTSQVDGAREQQVGVNFDEETVNLLAAQRAYEAAARVMTTMDSVLDTLINRTGVTR
ncbi:MAG TPA: flagellar hook-associated protein FlgK [Nocardioides sp.]|uniref:flagellar hook-associated protein FlgK n=1 Tax=uncultured Nocardioides sp. TaxID=198441 RepID=UPI000EDC3CDD|nr:flagellar hook-associated protein FlgK [uncultured Nocardioides sp.]HCB03997.1 flagellar hook-associated protein FlgK [Nocardioides sp.]HRD61727.1 flagellar hook-associated protein FlgK [Nocardioides sp.]HRI95366.1 flagellar hook-associated protein FlgK [Nocardioides sp.]HRK47176.1 flagellar hook-associated protein FlgK [Nocardioides sp.]